MHHIHWSTTRVLAGERVEAWGCISRQYFGRLNIASLDDSPLDASLEAYDVGALRMYRIAAPAHLVVRDAACGELPSDECYKLVLQVNGRGTVEQHNSRVMLQPGQWILYDPRRSYSITNSERCVLLVIQVPRSLLPGLRLPAPHAGTNGIGNIAGLHGVFGSYLRALSEQLPRLPDGVGQAVGESVTGLLGSTLAETLQHAGEPMPLPLVLKLRVRQYVQAHLSDAELNIQRIADAMGCSKRYLHRVFEDDAAGLERQIWTSRLERCHAALAHTAGTGRSVAEIGFAWGFKSSAHFSRSFKEHYGLTPGECQRQGVQVGAAGRRSSRDATPERDQSEPVAIAPALQSGGHVGFDEA